jgi:hypothetical protein
MPRFVLVGCMFVALPSALAAEEVTTDAKRLMICTLTIDFHVPRLVSAARFEPGSTPGPVHVGKLRKGPLEPPQTRNPWPNKTHFVDVGHVDRAVS